MHINARDIPPPLHFCFIIDTPPRIQVILDSLDLQKRQYELRSSVTDIGRKSSTIVEQEKQPVSVNGTTHIHEPSNNLRGKMRNSVSYKHYVRQLIPENIKDVEFIYNVNFQTGKGKHFISIKRCARKFRAGNFKAWIFFFIFKMPDGRAPRGRASRESIPWTSILCRYILEYLPTYTIDRELTFYSFITVH